MIIIDDLAMVGTDSVNTKKGKSDLCPFMWWAWYVTFYNIKIIPDLFNYYSRRLIYSQIVRGKWRELNWLHEQCSVASTPVTSFMSN